MNLCYGLPPKKPSVSFRSFGKWPERSSVYIAVRISVLFLSMKVHLFIILIMNCHLYSRHILPAQVHLSSFFVELRYTLESHK